MFGTPLPYQGQFVVFPIKNKRFGIQHDGFCRRDRLEIESAVVRADDLVKPRADGAKEFRIVDLVPGNHRSVAEMPVFTGKGRDLRFTFFQFEQSDLAFCARAVVVARIHEHADIGAGIGHNFVKFFVRGSIHPVVGVQKVDKFSLRAAQTVIAGCARSPVFLLQNNEPLVFILKFAQNFDGRIRRAVVHTDNFQRVKGLPEHAFDALFQIKFRVINRNDNRYLNVFLFHLFFPLY